MFEGQIKLLRLEARGTKNAEAAGFAHCRDDPWAMTKSKNGDVHPIDVTEGIVHTFPPGEFPPLIKGRCLLSKIVWPTEEAIKHRQRLLNDALFFVRKQCQPLGDKINLSAVQRLNDRPPLLGNRHSDPPAITDRIHFAQPALALHA